MSTVDQDKAVASIGNVSTMLRKAIGASLPVAPEQYLTIAIPGTVIDLTPIEEGGTYTYDVSKYVIAPTQVRQAEAKLVDGMMPLSNIMIGNTGKSVSRSYARALDSLVASKATINTGNKIRSPGDPQYDAAMTYLTTVNEKTGLTPVDIYGQKQRKWAIAQDEWDQAKITAMKTAQSQHPADHVAALQAYNDWNQTHFRRYKSAVQAEWMDWVSNGHKYDVEYSFGTVDIDSIMARIEDSKESMRISSLIDTDGANEVQGVELTPKEWATMCTTVKKPVPTYTIDQLNAEIARLTRMQVAYDALKDASTKTPPFPGAPAVSEDEMKAADKAVSDSLAALLTAQATLNSSTETDKEKLATLKKNVEDARQKLSENQQAQSKVMEALNKFNMANGDKANQEATAAWLKAQLLTVASQLKQLGDKRDALIKAGGSTVPVVTGAHEKGVNGADSSGTDVAPAGAEYADPIFGISGPPGAPGGSAPTSNDSWTEIALSFSSQDQSQNTDTSSWGMSVGGGVGWGLWSVGGNYAHDQSSSDMQSDMSSCDVNISFQALVVNIRRPWLYAELFSDNELDTASGIKLSPGPENIQKWMAKPKESISDLAKYNMFPAFPTSFIIAANTTIEFHGNTQHIEQHMSSQSNSGSVSVGYGPWSVNSSFHQSSSHQSFSMQATSTGCKLSFNAPQIIGWVSQILPALPRNPNFEPIVQNLVPQ